MLADNTHGANRHGSNRQRADMHDPGTKANPPRAATRPNAARRAARVMAVALLCLIAAPFATTVFATTVRYLDAAALIANSATITHVRVTHAASSYDDRGIIVTRYTLDVRETLKGAKATRLEIELPGGRVGDRVLSVPGLSRYSVGDELVLFLEPKRMGDRTVPVGFDQGVWRVRRDDSGQSHVVRTMKGLRRVRTKSVAPSTRADLPNRAPLEQFKDRIKKTIRAGSSTTGGKR